MHKQHYIFGDQFIQKMQKSSDSMYSSIFMTETYFITILPDLDRILKKLWILFQLLVLEDPN